jgi:hypothetical protein
VWSLVNPSLENLFLKVYSAPDAWGAAQARPLAREDWTLIASVTGERLQPFEGGSDSQGMLAGP